MDVSQSSFARSTLLVVAIGTLAACGGGGGAARTVNFSATVAQGATVGATCTATEAVSGSSARTFSAAAPSNASGVVNFVNLPADVNSLIVSCTGGNYFDEATGTTKQSATVKSVLRAGATSVAVTPLTSLIASKVEQAVASSAAGSVVPVAQVDAVATQVASIFAPSINLLNPPRVITNAAEAASINSSDEANQYAAVLAGFSQLSADLGLDQADVVDALIADLADDVVGDDLNLVGASATVTNFQQLITELNESTTTVAPAAAQAVAANPDNTNTTVTQPTTEPAPVAPTGSTGSSN